MVFVFTGVGGMSACFIIKAYGVNRWPRITLLDIQTG